GGRGDLSWVMYLNAFVLLLVAGTSLFGQLPGPAGQVAARLAGGAALQAGLLLPLFFMSFALLESIKSSIGIWWEKAQSSLEVLLYTPVDDPSLIWLEVLPGAIVSVVWVTAWMGAGMALLALFGEPAPWDLLPVFAFVAGVTAYWAAMGRMLGFMLFPREGAAGGAWGCGARRAPPARVSCSAPARPPPPPRWPPVSTGARGPRSELPGPARPSTLTSSLLGRTLAANGVPQAASRSPRRGSPGSW